MTGEGPYRLREVAHRGPRDGHGAAWFDTLSCGHVVPFDGAHAVQRRVCRECSPAPVCGGQEALFGGDLDALARGRSEAEP